MTHSKLTPTYLDIAIAEKNKSLQAEFLKELNPEQFKTIQKAIAVHFSKGEIKTHNAVFPHVKRSFNQIDMIMGLAYTSSSSYAGYWVCNTEVYNDKYPGFNYIGFALSQDGKAYGILWDKDENEIIIPL